MKAKILAHNFTGKSLTIVFTDDQGKTHTKIADSSHLNWKPLEAAFRAGKLDKVIQLIDVTSTIKALSGGKFTISGGKVYRNGQEAHGYLFERLLGFLKDGGGEYKRLLLFADNLYANPDQKTHQDLYKFLENGGFPITKDGCFLAYKGVQSDFYSRTAGKLKLLKGTTNAEGKILNAPGEEIEVDRTEVNPDPNQTCSYGLHAGSYNYANNFKNGGKLVIVKVNPRDVVAIPVDESHQKLRTAKYKVVAEEGGPLDDGDMEAEEKIEGRHAVRGPNGKFTKA